LDKDCLLDSLHHLLAVWWWGVSANIADTRNFPSDVGSWQWEIWLNQSPIMSAGLALPKKDPYFANQAVP